MIVYDVPCSCMWRVSDWAGDLQAQLELEDEAAKRLLIKVAFYLSFCPLLGFAIVSQQLIKGY